MVTKIVELYQQQLHIYPGDYDHYETEKALRMELQQRAFENQQDYIRQQERFVERFKAKASKATQAQSIIKRLEKLERLEEASLERPSIRINFQVERTPGRTIATLRNVSKRFGDLTILENASAEIERGDKVALIGANGKGKSTLLRIVSGMENFDGERVPGHNVTQSFYAQHQLEALHLGNTILEEMLLAGSQKTEMELRTLLGCFLFSGDDADKRIRVLSGGEKARVALAKTIVGKANFLLLDEPTNHLDMHSVNLLIEALDRYEGSYILVSHDRYFISRTANKIWSIENGAIREFKGGYEEWVAWNERMQKQQAATVALTPVPKPQVEKEKEKTKPEARNTKPAQPDRDRQARIKKLEKRMSELEASIESLQSEKTTLEQLLSTPDIYGDKARFSETERKYKDLMSRLTVQEKEFEDVFHQLDREIGN
jgi:ATP-binding cassette subfamily F protein 3